MLKEATRTVAFWVVFLSVAVIVGTLFLPFRREEVDNSANEGIEECANNEPEHELGGLPFNAVDYLPICNQEDKNNND